MNHSWRAAPTDQTDDEWLAEFDGRVKSTNPTRLAVALNEGDECSVESAPLVPVATYKLTYIEHFTAKAKNTGKLNISMSITEGSFSGLIQRILIFKF